jgi:hypothetical protein
MQSSTGDGMGDRTVLHPGRAHLTP